MLTYVAEDNGVLALEILHRAHILILVHTKGWFLVLNGCELGLLLIFAVPVADHWLARD